MSATQLARTFARPHGLTSGRLVLRSASTWAHVTGGPPDPILGEHADEMDWIGVYHGCRSLTFIL